jgi:hypothetical protein
MDSLSVATGHLLEWEGPMTVAARRVNARKTAGYPIIRSVCRVIAMGRNG